MATNTKSSDKKTSTAKKDSNHAKKDASHAKKDSNHAKKNASHAKKSSTSHKTSSHKGESVKQSNAHHHENNSHTKSNNNSKYMFIGLGVLAIVVIVALGFILLSNTDNSSKETTNVEQSSQSGDVLAVVNGEEISSDEVSEIQQQLSLQGQQISQEQALNQAVTVELLRQKVDEEGYMLSKEEVEADLKSQLEMQGMSIEDYKSQIETQGMSYDSVVEDYRFQFGVEDYLADKVGNETPEVSQQEIEEYYNLYKQQAGENVSSLEEVRDRLVQSIEQEKLNEQRSKFIEELVSNANVEYK